MEHSKVAIQGFSRVQIEENGKIVGDSGFVGPNQITNLGVLNFLVNLLGKTTGSSQVGFVALGTGGTAASDATNMTGEIMGGTKRKVVTVGNVASTTAEFTATFASGDSFLTATAALSNIGLFAASSGGTLFAGNTYASSSCGTNQSVNVTYQVRFSRA